MCTLYIKLKVALAKLIIWLGIIQIVFELY